jgi:pilus assembly protein CpaB
MKRRIIGIIGAIVLASVGTVALVAYVQSARDEADAAEAMVDVWVVKSTIAEGTPAADVKGSVERTQVPGRLVADGAVRDFDELEGLVTGAALLPGEQVVAARFVTPIVARQGDVPAGLLQVTVELDPQRALGGRIRAGDTVAVFLSFASDGAGSADRSHLELHKVLVTSVQISDDAEGVPDVAGEGGDATDTSEVASAPTESLLVTLALDARSVEQVVFAAEFGTVWLGNEPADAPEEGTRIVDGSNVYDVLVNP